jgi:uncharacterized protein (DUF488 family)
MTYYNVFTIGFTKSSAQHFFQRLQQAGVRKIIDVRLNNKSQLSGFAKASDLPYFLQSLGDIEYVHQPLLAPTESMLKAYKRDKGDWGVYAGRFLDLMKEREIETRITRETLRDACLLCSEDKPHQCHRRLVCDYLNDKWNGSLSVRHL